MGKRGRAARRAGRKRDPNAKRRSPRQGERDAGTEELRAKRRLIAGSADVGLDFPLDVLLARGFITIDQRDEGLRYTMLHWWFFGFPHAGCEALYDRMCSGVVGDDFSPRLEGETDDPEEHKRRLERVKSNKARLERMEEALINGRRGLPGGLHALELVKRAGPFLRLPAALFALAAKTLSEELCRIGLKEIADALEILVKVRDEEDRNYRRRRRASWQRGEAPAAGDLTKGVFTY